MWVARVANWLDTEVEREGIWNGFQVFWVEQWGAIVMPLTKMGGTGRGIVWGKSGIRMFILDKWSLSSCETATERCQLGDWMCWSGAQKRSRAGDRNVWIIGTQVLFKAMEGIKAPREGCRILPFQRLSSVLPLDLDSIFKNANPILPFSLKLCSGNQRGFFLLLSFNFAKMLFKL